MTEAQIKHMVDRFLMWKLPGKYLVLSDTPERTFCFTVEAGKLSTDEVL